MRFSILGSGSGGNATLVACDEHAVLVDCGFSLRQVEQRLRALDFPATSVRALLLTHEHDDHVAGAAAFSRKYQVPLYLTPGTRLAAGDKIAHAHACIEFLPDGEFALGPFSVAPVTVPHDARQPCQFVIGDGLQRLGILTDTGRITPHLVRHFQALDALVLEFNHDLALLAKSAYPASLQARIAGHYGHLSNAQSTALLQRLDHAGLRHVVAAHLSEKTNTVATVEACLREYLAPHVSWGIASQHAAMPWHDMSADRGR